MIDAIPDLPEDLVPGYRIEGELGHGGTATVYLARDRRTDARVAVKVLRPELAACLGARRFQLEIRIAGDLAHPNIVPVLDSGAAGGKLYYVMPYVAGETLRQRLTRDVQLPVAEALGIARQVAEALGHAHRRGIVHRDIKPENILLEADRAVVADFGVARAIEYASSERLTETGLAVGTAVYMSPEQGGAKGRVDGRSDLYSLGCVLYEMLAGEPPFTGSSPRAIVAKHMQAPIPDVRVVRPTIFAGVQAVIARTLAKVPADRYGSAEELAEGLQTAASARAVWRRPAALAGVAAGLAALLMGAWLVRQAIGRGAQELVEPPHLAVLYFDADSADDALRRLADGITEELTYELSGVDAFRVVSRSGMEAFRGRRAPVDSLATALHLTQMVDGKVQRWRGGVRVRAQLIDGATDTYLDSLSLEQPVGDSLTFTRDVALQLAAGIRRSLGRVARLRLAGFGSASPRAGELARRAQQARDEAKAIAESPHPEDLATARAAFQRADSLLELAQQADPGWGRPWIDRGWIAADLAGLATGPDREAGLRQGLRFAEEAVRRLPDRAEALELRGAIRTRLVAELQTAPDEQDRVELAEADLRAALDRQPHSIQAWQSLANLLWSKGSIAEAAVASRRALQEDTYLSDAPAIYHELFYDDLMLGNFAQAGEWCRRGRVSFPGRWRFVECALTLMRHDPDAAPDADSAWALVRTLERLYPPERARAEGQAYHLIYRRMVAATISARAGRPEVGLAEIARAREAVRGDSTLALDLNYDEAVLRAALHQPARARTLIEDYVTARPLARDQLARDPLLQGWLAGR